MTFTIGRGDEIGIAAITALAARAVAPGLGWITQDAGRFWLHLTWNRSCGGSARKRAPPVTSIIEAIRMLRGTILQHQMVRQSRGGTPFQMADSYPSLSSFAVRFGPSLTGAKWVFALLPLPIAVSGSCFGFCTFGEDLCG